MPLQTIRVTPADRKNGKAKQDAKVPCDPICSSRMDDDEGECGRRRSSSFLGSSGDICRICHCEGAPDQPLISPCWCCGSLRFVHQSCLQQWIKSSDARCCELCKFHFVMRTTLKPFTKWEKLDLSPVERRKVLCSITFHAVAITCVVWSLYVLIERTAEEVRSGALEWPFWTKLVVVAVGFTGGVVFMYVQCRMYAQLFRRWRAYNRIIQVQDAPHDKLPAQQAVLSAAAQMITASVLADEKRTSPDEEEFHSCESGGGTSGEEEPAEEATPAAETGSTKTTLTSVTDSEQHHQHHHPLGEVVVVPAGGEELKTSS